MPQQQIGPATPGVHYPEGYIGPTASAKQPFSDGSKTLRVVVPQDPDVVGDWNTNEFSAWLEQRTGLKIQYEAVLLTAPDGSQDMTKINAMIASGDLPDAFLGIGFTMDQISLYGQQGAFVALDDYIETYAPEMRRMRQQYPDMPRFSEATDGNTYLFQGLNDCFHCRCGVGRSWINREYVEAVGGRLPETTEDLRELLKLMKAQDPTPGRNLIALGGSVGNPLDTYFMNSFLYNPGGTGSGGWLRLDNDRVEFVANRPEWREALRYLRSLNDDGVLDRSAFTMTDDEMLRTGNQQRFGFVRAHNWGSFIDTAFAEDAPWQQYVALPPLTGPTGVRYATWNYYGYSFFSGLVITSSCEYPELLVQWGDYQMELEATMRSYLGNPGNWSFAAEGAQGINGKQAVWSQQRSPAPVGTGWEQNGVMYRSNDFRLGQLIDPARPDYEKSLYDASAAAYEPYAAPQEFQLPPLTFEESAAVEKASMAASIYGHVTSSMAKFAIGELDINDESAWTAYTRTFDDIGMSRYLDIHQEAYESRPR